MGDRDRGIIPIFTGTGESEGEKRYSFFEILGFIEQLSFNERKGIAISEEAITTISFTRYVEVGFTYSFIATLIITLVLPFNFGILDKIFPVFGTYNYRWYDVCFIFLHSSYPSLGTALLAFAIFHKCFMGPVTARAIQCLKRGLMWGKIAGTGCGWVSLQIVYTMVINNPKTYQTIMKIFQWRFINKPDWGYRICETLYSLKHAAIQASWFLVAVCIVHLFILWLGTFIAKRNTNRILYYRKKWGLPSWIAYTTAKDLKSP